MQYHAIPCNTMQYNAMPCNTWTGSPPDFRSQAGDQCPEKVGMKLFWVLHASDARRWGSVIHIWNSTCLRIRLVQLNLDLVNPVQHRDSLKVARVQKCHPGFTLATPWLHPGYTLATPWLHPGYTLATSL